MRKNKIGIRFSLKNRYKNTKKLKDMMIYIKIINIFRLKNSISVEKVSNRFLLGLKLIEYRLKLWKLKEIH